MTPLIIGVASALTLGAGLIVGFATKPREGCAVLGLFLVCIGALGIVMAVARGRNAWEAGGLLTCLVWVLTELVIWGMFSRLPD